MQALRYQEKYRSCKCQCRYHVEYQRMPHEGDVALNPEKFHSGLLGRRELFARLPDLSDRDTGEFLASAIPEVGKGTRHDHR